MNEDHMEQVPEIPMDKDIFEQQRWILDRTVEFARNAEQKASILFGVFAIFFGIFMSSDVLSAYLTQGVDKGNPAAGTFFVFALIAALVSLGAFIGIVVARLRAPKASMIYFGSLANCNVDDIRKGLANGVAPSDLAEQILVNAKISSLKYRLFNVCAIASPVSILFAAAFAIATFA